MNRQMAVFFVEKYSSYTLIINSNTFIFV